MAEHPLQIQQNSFDLKSNNLKILVIQYLWAAVPRPEGLLFISFNNKTGRSHEHVEQDRQIRDIIRRVCITTVAMKKQQALHFLDVYL
jgi:hypothetical protein